MTEKRDGYKYSHYTMEWETIIQVDKPKPIAIKPIKNKIPEITTIPINLEYYRNYRNYRQFMNDYSNQLEELFMDCILSIEDLNIPMSIDNSQLFSEFCRYIYLKAKDKI